MAKNLIRGKSLLNVGIQTAPNDDIPTYLSTFGFEAGRQVGRIGVSLNVCIEYLYLPIPTPR